MSENAQADEQTFVALSHALQLGHRWLQGLLDNIPDDEGAQALLKQFADGAEGEIAFPLNATSGRIELRVKDAAGNWQPLIVEEFEIEDLGDAPQAASA